jgi:hypothetical protein
MTCFNKSVTILLFEVDGEVTLESHELVTQLREFVAEIPNLKSIREGVHHPHVKGWKTRLEDTLDEGGKTCVKALTALRKMRNNLGGSAFIRSQTYLNQLDSLERTLRQTIQTIEVLGRPEDRAALPNWGKPKSQQRAVGHLMVGEEEVSTQEITIHEVMDCLKSLAEDSNDLTDKMRQTLIGHLDAVLDDDLLEPFLNQHLGVLLGHWPEFKEK